MADPKGFGHHCTSTLPSAVRITMAGTYWMYFGQTNLAITGTLETVDKGSVWRGEGAATAFKGAGYSGSSGMPAYYCGALTLEVDGRPGARV
ncbi:MULTISPECIES: hypothetical protein [Arthrobacter]|uniref:Uncharacterized protein n=1 Tax=Arthrobacter terricola TaxID=2547396 RepID=A0A4R5L1M6_9MICC|nr:MULTISPECIES: hypothetical protein [Arthrobacter]MBT8158910.1 hypothetical protein [Arthrobacter sp. GN70]TDG01593.1 hypothetical protein E1809_00395 [Arthrobacter terricola]